MFLSVLNTQHNLFIYRELVRSHEDVCISIKYNEKFALFKKLLFTVHTKL